MKLSAPTAELLIGGSSAVNKRVPSNFAERRRRALKRVDRELSRGNFETALSQVKQLQKQPFLLRGFGAAKQVARKSSALEGHEFDGLDTLSVGHLVDSVLDSIHTNPSHLPLVDEVETRSCEEDHLLCLQHEAGHFLVGYLIGSLPKKYKVPSLEELRLNDVVKAKVEFIGFEFLREVGVAEKLKRNNQIKAKATDAMGNRGMVSSKTLNAFSCIILGGLVAEYLAFGHAEGHLADLQKLHNTMEWLGMSEDNARFQMKWAALNTIFILHNHQQAREMLVEAMADGQSVGFCIDAIESSFHH
ncbi:hypothetical protein LINPERHAP1_LOCUS7848 [Linum perenne]